MKTLFESGTNLGGRSRPLARLNHRIKDSILTRILRMLPSDMEEAFHY